MSIETWYSVFVSPTQNIHYFTLELPKPDENCNQALKAKMKLVADRSATDKRILNVTYRVHVEFHGPFVAVLAKDDKLPSDGVNVMVLKRDDSKKTLEGIFTWNSLTGGTIKSERITWTSIPSESHRRMIEPQ
jgi:hypothetical protein